MQRSLEVLKENLAKVRTGRAHTGLLDQVDVEYYGSPVPVSQAANVTLIDARTIGVKPFESNMAGAIEKPSAIVPRPQSLIYGRFNPRAHAHAYRRAPP